ncbi:MAG: S-layer homology domain-containing protein, partial [Thermoanaerobaculaceae bacterium]|nr:S-layer homology domain-containing protein [Thermoanaerobaculaceae bacterium]
SPTPTPPPGQGPALAIDATAARHPISPDIYGLNFASEPLAQELRLPVRRWGGNSTSRFNYLLDTTNTGMDWYYENIPQANDHPELLPTGNTVDRFVEQDRRTGSRSLVTVPLVGHVAKRRTAGHPFDCGFKVSVYGPQQSVDPWDPDCGDGLHTNGTPVTGNNPLDTSVAVDAAFVQGYVAHLVSRFGDAAHGGVAYYNLDNEPMLWSDTHRDVHPSPTSYDEMRDRTITYAAAVKAADPTAKTLGPVVWGWTAYFWSALDWASGGNWWEHPQDRLAHGDVPFIDWYLGQMAAYETQHGQRLLDLLDVHFYPPGVALSGAGSAATQALRLRSTRLVWDPTYSEESWIGQPVYLVPRMKQWVADHYPGTGTAVTEYNWGALDHINGALAQADVLGIFGREGLDVATLWGPPEATQPGAFAFRVFRSYDGAGASFGETGVQAGSADQGVASVYAAQRTADGALTVVVINKTGTALTSQVTLAGYAPSGAAQVWRYSSANLAAIVHEADLPVGAAFSATFPASSITLLVVPGDLDDNLRPSLVTVDTQSYSGGSSNANGVLEAGEQVVLSPSWRNVGPGAQSVTGTLTGFSGAGGGTFQILDAASSYGSVPAGQTRSCTTTGNCFAVGLGQPASRPAHWDVTASEQLGSGRTRTWTLHVGGSFADVPASHWAYVGVEALFHAGLTTGCLQNPLRYCPESLLNRAEMAAFLERAKHGPAYVPPAATGTLFADVPASHWAAAYIEQLHADGLTTGCGQNPLRYCPEQQLTRAEMAVFLLRLEHGPAYTPPAGTGAVFSDVPTGYWAVSWIEQLFAEGITTGCGGGRYCPDQPLPRSEMAVFLTRTLGLTLAE